MGVEASGWQGATTENIGDMDVCEAAYLLFSVPYFLFTERKRAARNKKYYPIDTGSQAHGRYAHGRGQSSHPGIQIFRASMTSEPTGRGRCSGDLAKNANPL
jgi:hypothetical protein